MRSAALSQLEPHRAAATIVEEHAGDGDWLDAFAEAFERELAGRDLERILRVWGLSRSEAGRLFGVTRQAVAKWLDGRVPAERAAQIADLAAATDVLVHHLKRERIPAVVRRPAPGLGDASLLDLLAGGDTRRLLDATRAMFAFGDAHP